MPEANYFAVFPVRRWIQIKTIVIAARIIKPPAVRLCLQGNPSECPILHQSRSLSPGLWPRRESTADNSETPRLQERPNHNDAACDEKSQSQLLRPVNIMLPDPDAGMTGTQINMKLLQKFWRRRRYRLLCWCAGVGDTGCREVLIH